MDDTTSWPGRPRGLVKVMNDTREQQTFKQWGESTAGEALKPALSDQTVWTSTHQGNEWRRTPAHLTPPALVTVFSRMKKHIPSHQSEKVRTIVINIKTGKERLEACVQTIRDARLERGSRDIAANLRETQAIRKTAHGHSYQLWNIEEAVDANSGQLQALGNNVEAMRATIEQCRQELRGMVPLAFVERIQNALYAVFNEDTTREQIRLQTQSRVISVEDLLAILCVDPLLPSRDVRQVLRQGTSMRNDLLQKAAWLLVTPHFKEWMGQRTSGVLLVDGNCGAVGIGRTSPLSAFCGMHAGLQDPFSGPRGMLRLLLSQLILYPGKPAISLDFVEAALYDGIRSQELGGLCYLFEQLIIRCTSLATILCIIDGIADLEFSPEWRNETLQVMAFLRQLVNQHRTSPTLKLLLTNSNRSGSGLRGMVNEGEHVTLLSGNMNLRPVQQQLSTGQQHAQRPLAILSLPQLHEQPASASSLVELGPPDFLHISTIRPRSAGGEIQAYHQ
ncbi:hypothetical protein DHEL01_v210159 [Diaporthe helianthi]|uniref:Uncharacterized protein n=1 Tax=Diaporthe helianthi TaxID=158607 RepID=A0A2P5HMH4_DIAHE|nr:hypothetical protein DHEL01_v210159 [Diaporthe helianthi]